MPIEDLLLSGINLMLIGMGIVFTFLFVLVLVMKGMSGLALMVSERQGAAETSASHTSLAGQNQAGMRGDLVAVISAAVKQYRSIHN
ncbi:MAG: OadG family protein [Candidatus Thiodiazotropha sp.]|jgi:oxaloacetate decarboxylase (Na+ extruding) subunit gamma